MILLRKSDQAGFDRAHVTLARKFSLLASHAFAARQASLTEAESNRLKDLTEKLKASQEALRFRANYDQLTGLSNRSYVGELVDQIIGRKKPGEHMALAFIDLDGFKRVNDEHGHAVGDTLLQEVASRVRAEIRRTDIFGRISGDDSSSRSTRWTAATTLRPSSNVY
jgi:PleD family two-component response regulator